MADRDPRLVQLDFPQLTADLIATLRLTGTLGLLNLSDTVIPVISVGDVRPPTFSFTPTTFSSSQVVAGNDFEPAPNSVIADTGPLVSGTYDLQLSLCKGGLVTIATDIPHAIEHRNAANNATLARLLVIGVSGANAFQQLQTSVFGYVISGNERLRIISTDQIVSNGSVGGVIMFAIRPTP